MITKTTMKCPNYCTFILFVFHLMKIVLGNNNNDINQHMRDAGDNITRILNAFFDSGYDKRVRPNYGGPPVEVGVTMQIIGISSVSEVQMDFTSDFYFRQLWRDNRLAFKARPGITELVVGAEVAQKIWVPDTFFANEKSAYFHLATTPNTFLRIGSNGEVYRSIRLTVTSSCPMNLQYFPMDRQICSILIESYGYSTADISYKWRVGAGSVKLSKELELPQFKVVGHRQSNVTEVLSTGNYSRLVCEIQFVRSMGYYLIQIYIPASLIVIISWVSFWLHRNATPARVALGVTTVLTMTTLMSSTNAALPKISYIKSIDVFLGTCFVMVFASLLEYATVGYLGKRIAMRKTRSQQLAKLAQEHRNRCAAAAAAAQALETCPPDSVIPGPILCPAASIDSGQVTRQMSVKGIPVHHTLERSDRIERYQGMGTPRLSHHSIPCPQEVRLKMIDAKSFGKSHAPTVENTLNGGGGGLGDGDTPSTPAAGGSSAAAVFGCKNPNKLFGVSPSDIDKYSRVVFPVCFVCFNLMYWIIYLHISERVPVENLVPLGG